MSRIAKNFTPPTPQQIRAVRDRLGLTQVELADAIGVTSRTVQRWESGETYITKMAWIALFGLRNMD